MSDHERQPWTITQRKLRNNSGAILPAVEGTASFTMTRDGTSIAQIIPLKKQTFVSAEQAFAIFAHDAPLDPKKFFSDIDSGVNQELFGQ